MTIDGVRWQEIFNGIDDSLGCGLGPPQSTWREASALTPHLHLLANQGVLLGSAAAPMWASSPATISLPGYSEIFSGRSPNCSTNECAPVTEPTLLDAWLEREPGARLGVISSWSRIPRMVARDLSAVTVSAGQNYYVHQERFCDDREVCRRLRAGSDISPWPGTDDYRPDWATAALALGYLRSQNPQFLFIGLGDTDEHAHHGDYARYLEALHQADATLGTAYQWLQEQELRGHRTLLVVTTDHGRARGFRHHSHSHEAARVWALFAGSVVTERGLAIAEPSRLADIAPTISSIIGLPRDTDTRAGHSLSDLLSGRHTALASLVEAKP